VVFDVEVDLTEVVVLLTVVLDDITVVGIVEVDVTIVVVVASFVICFFDVKYIPAPEMLAIITTNSTTNEDTAFDIN
jgi:hypothetical protein